MSAKCLRCGAESAWIKGEVPDEQTAIYVVVHVTYDYFRFQGNLAATTDLMAARAIAEDASKLQKYGEVIEDVSQSVKMNESETCHILIETYEP